MILRTYFSQGLIEHYIQRTDQLEDVSLAEFAAMYDFQSNSKVVKINPEFEDGNSDQEDLPLRDNPSLFPLKDSGYMRFRRKPKVIRFRRYIIIQYEVNFYREQLMLYFPWRNESLNLIILIIDVFTRLIFILLNRIDLVMKVVTKL